MSKYKVNEPSALKFLNADGAVVDEKGNVVSDASDYWKKVYDQAEPKVAKYLHADGTVDENPGSGGADLEDNHQTTIDVSTYTEPVEIEPTEGKDGMKKATVTLSNIPSGGGATAYAWMANGAPIYFPISVAPIDKADYLEKCKMGGFCQTETTAFVINSSYASNDDEYSRISDSEFSIAYEDGEETITTTFTRYALADFTLW